MVEDCEGSLFDQYDIENGYETGKEVKDEYEETLNSLYQIQRIGIENYKMSLKEVDDYDIFNLIDYIIFNIENPIEKNE